ncbi:hypothetical protein GWI33_004842 [Rhynchophorus ferrugineus]|uniref:Calcineurin-like phosphoesterase domain-containing protein n=1 Tax=Rhynchophorus ferrugineus TaxID=354439 RepID=A0A834IK85_RHYFE|nr:hypothetical protein GWI33_004842 [Rhynchophorus ferrugineus]
MRLRLIYLIKIFVGLLFVFLYCEYLIYYLVQMKCSWPTLDPLNEDISIKQSDEAIKVMIIADTHLLGSLKGHWFDKIRREWQMYRAFQTAMQLHSPDIVFVLGDLLDEGSFCSDAEFQYYIGRFYSLFYVPDTTQMHIVVGNHDIGFHYRIHPHLTNRFNKAFKSSPVQLISIKDVNFVLINSMALQGDGCFLCKPAEEELNKIERSLLCAQNLTAKCNNIYKLATYSKPIMMQHYPLYRKSDIECFDFDAAPVREKEEIFRETWDCLSMEATYQILKQVKPRLAFSGHTHHGCTRNMPFGDGIEITIPSFSWRNKNNPNYGLGVFTANNYAFIKCEMPKESDG